MWKCLLMLGTQSFKSRTQKTKCINLTHDKLTCGRELSSLYRSEVKAVNPPWVNISFTSHVFWGISVVNNSHSSHCENTRLLEAQNMTQLLQTSGGL